MPCSSVLPAALQAEGMQNSLQHCLLPPPGVLGDLQHELLPRAPRKSCPLGPPAVQLWWKVRVRQCKPDPAQLAAACMREQASMQNTAPPGGQRLLCNLLPASSSTVQAHSPFSRQFLILPLVGSEHASLLIVCQLGSIAAEGQGRPVGAASSGGGSSRPCILHLDSLQAKGRGHKPNFDLLRFMLEDAAREVSPAAAVPYPCSCAQKGQNSAPGLSSARTVHQASAPCALLSVRLPQHGVAAGIEFTRDNLPAVSASVSAFSLPSLDGALSMCKPATPAAQPTLPECLLQRLCLPRLPQVAPRCFFLVSCAQACRTPCCPRWPCSLRAPPGCRCRSSGRLMAAAPVTCVQMSCTF